MRPYEIIILYRNKDGNGYRFWRILTDLLNEETHYQEAQERINKLPEKSDIYKWYVVRTSFYD